MNKTKIVYQRLNNQRLSSSDLKRPAEVVRWLGAVQAQDFNGAKWSLAQRMRDTTDAVIEKAYNEGKILRTHVMRPTWHFVVPADIRWLLQLTAPRVNISLGSNYRKFELDDDIFKRCNKILTSALKGGKHRTRASLKEILNKSGIAVDDPVRLVHILVHAELDAIICSGPMAGKQFTYALLDERVPQTKSLDRDEALAKLTRSYFRSHGPATLRDFTWWSGLAAADARNGIAMVERHLITMVHDEQIFWSAPATKAVQNPTAPAHLLSAFDEYIIAYKDRKAVIGSNNLSSTVNGLMGPAIIVNGEVVGTWKRTADKQTVKVDVKAFRALKNAESNAIRKALDRFAKFLGLAAGALILSDV